MEIVTTTGRRIIVGADVDGHAPARVLAVWRKAFGEGRRGPDEVIGFAPAMIVPEEEASPGAAGGRSSYRQW